MAATSGITRSATTPTIRHVQEIFGQLRIGAGATNSVVEGRRHASVKSQGAYKLRDSSTIPKKLGAKKTGGTQLLSTRQPYFLWHSNCSSDSREDIKNMKQTHSRKKNELSH